MADRPIDRFVPRFRRKTMKPFLLALAAFVAVLIGFSNYDATSRFAGVAPSSHAAVATAFREQKSGLQVRGEGVVIKLLPDDNQGRRHQRFILQVASGQTLLVAHNIDLAPRVAGLATGSSVKFNGVYEWNSKGGTIHWTHRDPAGRHAAGWLKHGGRTYQ